MRSALVKRYWLQLLVVLVIAAQTLLVNHYRGNAITYRGQRDEKAQKLALASATIDDMRVRQRDVAALDEKYTKELADANAENAALQRKLDAGGRVLVKGHCPMPATTEATISAGVGHDATVELSDAAGRNVLGIRSGIKKDHSALRVLQEYIKKQCLN